MTDVWTTVGVVVGVGAAGLTGWYVLDPLVAIAVAANILREGYRLVRRSIDGLMDAALGDAEIRAIEEALERLGREEARFANLRTRRAGANRFAQVELRVPEDWRVGHAHRLAVAAEQALVGQAVTLKVQVIPESGAAAATARAAPQFSVPAAAATIAGPLPGRKPGRSDAEKGTGMSCRIEVSYGEVLDKISILEIKAARIADEARQANVAHELERLRASWTAASPRDAESLVADARAALKAVNEQLWDIEDRIRLKEKAKRFDDEFIELARSVYITNDERARLKREIDRVLGSSIVEEKSYQPY
jgi:uncharacterized protein YukE